MRWMNCAPKPARSITVAGRAIDFEAAELPSGPRRLSHELDRGVAPVPGRREHPRILRGHLAPGKANPRDISKDRAGRRQLAPEIQQHHFVGADRSVRGGGGLIVRIARVLLCGYARGIVGGQAFFGKPPHHRLLHFVLIESAAGRDALTHEVERPVLDSIEPLGCGAVSGQRLGGPHRFEPLHQIAGRDHLDAEVANGLDRSGVHPGNIGNRVTGRILHRDPFDAPEQLAETRTQLLTSGVGARLPGEGVEVVTLDGVDESPRHSGSRDAGSTSAGSPSCRSRRARSSVPRSDSTRGNRTAASRQCRPSAGPAGFHGRVAPSVEYTSRTWR